VGGDDSIASKWICELSCRNRVFEICLRGVLLLLLSTVDLAGDECRGVALKVGKGESATLKIVACFGVGSSLSSEL